MTTCAGNVIEIRDIAQLDDPQVAKIWDAAYAATERANWFQTRAWLKTTWQHANRRQSLRVLLLDGENPAVVPLCVRDEDFKVGPLRMLTFPLADHSGEYWSLGADRYEPLAIALRHIKQTERDWDVIDLRWTDEDDVEGARQAFKSAGLPTQVHVRLERPVVDLTSSADYESRLPRKLRRNLRSARRKLEGLGELRTTHARPQPGEDPRLDLYEACVEVARESWQCQKDVGLASTKLSAMVRALHLEAAAHGQVDLFVTWLDERPISFTYSSTNQGRWCGLFNGYLPEFAKTGVGALTVHEAILAAASQGDTFLDLALVGTNTNCEPRRTFANRIAWPTMLA